jgi:hypothetical protein
MLHARTIHTNSAEIILLEKLTVTQLVETSPAFIETEVSSPFSQQPATGKCAEPHESNPLSLNLLPWDQF